MKKSTNNYCLFFCNEWKKYVGLRNEKYKKINGDNSKQP